MGKGGKGKGKGDMNHPPWPNCKAGGLEHMKLLSNEEASELVASFEKDPKGLTWQKFIDLTITFSLKKDEAKDGGADATEAKAAAQKDGKEGVDEYQILKNVPDVRVFFGEEKVSAANEDSADDAPLDDLFDGDPEDY